MATFVLIHGGWFGGWCWHDVATALRANGHQVYTPTLTGLGERSHLASPLITLNTHAQDIANVLFYEDLQEVILLGHSYSGMPLSLVPKLEPKRIRTMVYLDAFVPQHNDSLAVLVEDAAGMRARAKESGFGWLTPPPPLARWHITDPNLIAKIEPRLAPHMFLLHDEQVDLTDTPNLPKTYISLTRHQKSHFVKIANRVKNKPDWQYLEVDAGHLVMVEEPDKLVACLESLA
ncbi:MAG: alpha/beta fold hydrolase [Chloroflexota bacterium]